MNISKDFRYYDMHFFHQVIDNFVIMLINLFYDVDVSPENYQLCDPFSESRSTRPL